MQCIITRPAHQSNTLNRALTAAGFETIKWPCVQIEADFQQAMQHLDDCAMAIFLSANAARLSLPCWHQNGDRARPMCLAIGPATAAQIQAQGVMVTAVAQPPSTEGLLALECLQAEAVRGKSVTVFCGYDPKPLLAQVLQSRGAKVRHVYCYRRLCPPPLTMQTCTAVDPSAVIISTSLSLLQNLLAMIPGSYLDQLHQHPLIVISETMQLFARENGFKNVYLAQDATDDAVVALLKSMQA